MLTEACTDACIMDFIEKKPNKFDYNDGIKGNKLLPSQKQGIAIARAILAKPKIIILDEATSLLDNESEKKVQIALNIINKKGITTIVIGNRINIVKDADMIFAIKEGKVIEQGTHDELLTKKGYYSKIIKSEIKKEILGDKDILKKKSLRNITLKYSNMIGQTMR